jgi:hypothetical protein
MVPWQHVIWTIERQRREASMMSHAAGICGIRCNYYGCLAGNFRDLTGCARPPLVSNESRVVVRRVSFE